MPDPSSDTISPIATPPMTPLAPSEDSNQSISLPVVTSSPYSSNYPVSSLPSTGTSFTNLGFTSLSSQAGLPVLNTSSQLSVLPTTPQTLSSQILIHNPQLGQPAVPMLATVSMSGTLPGSGPMLSSLLPGGRRIRTLSSSSNSKTRYFTNTEEPLVDKFEVSVLGLFFGKT